jgi:hypothetical protein
VQEPRLPSVHVAQPLSKPKTGEIYYLQFHNEEIKRRGALHAHGLQLPSAKKLPDRQASQYPGVADEYGALHFVQDPAFSLVHVSQFESSPKITWELMMANCERI